MTRPDAVIILGGGTDGTLKPVLYTKERLEAFSRLARYKNVPIIISGGYSVWIKRPKYTEAEVMKRYLEKSGFRRVLSEPRSRDTVGNVYFSKLIVKKHPDWKTILVVTTKGHRARSEWLFKTIFGKGFKFEYLEVPSKTRRFVHRNRKRYENYVIGVYKRLLKGIRPGDDRTVYKRLKESHPAFSKSARSKQIAREINLIKVKLLGYSNPNAK